MFLSVKYHLRNVRENHKPLNEHRLHHTLSPVVRLDDKVQYLDRIRIKKVPPAHSYDFMPPTHDKERPEYHVLSYERFYLRSLERRVEIPAVIQHKVRNTRYFIILIRKPLRRRHS